MPSSQRDLSPDRLRAVALDEHQFEALRQELRRKCREDLWFFAFHCCGYKDIDTELHRMMCKEWMNRSALKHTLWMVPRGHLKTSLWTVAGNLWELLRNRDLRVFIASGKDDKACDMLSEILSIIENNETFRFLFPEYCWDLAEDKLKKKCRIKQNRIDLPCSKWAGRKEGSIMAGSVESDQTGKHFDLLHYDDVVHEKNSETKLMLDKLWTWWRNQTPLQDSPESRWRYVGTPWHYLDISWRTVREEEAMRQQQREAGEPVKPNWHLFRLSVWVRGRDGKYLLDENGQKMPIWPERYTNESILDIQKKMGRYLFAAQYEVDPMPAEDAIFDLTQVKRIDRGAAPENVVNFVAVDLADDESMGGDYMVATAASFDDLGRMYVREIIRTRERSVLSFVNDIWRLCTKWNAVQVGVETTAFQRVLYRHYQHTAAKEGWNIPWREVKRYGTGSKTQRIRAIQPRVERGDFYIVEPLPNWDDLETEMRFFPKPPHDDILDTLADLEVMYYDAPRITVEPPKEYGTWDEVASWVDGIEQVGGRVANLGWR